MSALQSLAGTGPARHRPARSPHTRSPRARQRQGFDWAGQVKLAVVLSVAAAMVALLLADRVAEPVLLVGVIVVASILSWARIEPFTPAAHAPARHRR